jgi:hypothetical protein
MMRDHPILPKIRVQLVQVAGPTPSMLSIKKTGSDATSAKFGIIGDVQVTVVMSKRLINGLSVFFY